MINRRSRSHANRCTTLVLGLLSFLATGTASAQEQARHTLELGAAGQTTADLITPPYRVVYGVSPAQNKFGTPNEQAFGGPELGYRYAFTRNFSLEARVGYLFGHQPTVDLSGGNELLIHAGIRTTLPLGRRFSLFARVAPGLSSFDKADRFYLTGSNPPQRTGRITHFSVETSVGVTYRLAKHTALSFDVSEMSLIEGDELQGVVPSATNSTAMVYPGNIENHLLANIGLEHSFGRRFDRTTSRAPRAEADIRHLRNEVLFVWANQPQTYLSPQSYLQESYLTATNGFGLDASHSFRSWLDIDTSILTLPGGDAPNFQDGGSKTELLAGLKAGIRRPYYGVFAKLRPGVVTSPDTLNSTLTPETYVRNYNLVIDSGAAIEIYPNASHFVMRFDLGEVATRYAAVNVTTSNGTVTQPTQYKDAGLFTFGAGWRF